MAIDEFNLPDKIIECLKSNAETRFTARAIAEWIASHYHEYCKRKQKRKKPHKDYTKIELIRQITGEINTHFSRGLGKNERIKIMAGWPRQFYWTETDNDQEISSAALKPENDEEKSEASLYPLLMDYLRSVLNIFPMRIDEKTSSNRKGKDGNKWLHPDIVALEDLSRSWSSEVRECARKGNAESVLLWSFEVKPKLEGKNVRQSFFLAVSKFLLGALWLFSCRRD